MAGDFAEQFVLFGFAGLLFSAIGAGAASERLAIAVNDIRTAAGAAQALPLEDHTDRHSGHKQADDEDGECDGSEHGSVFILAV